MKHTTKTFLVLCTGPLLLASKTESSYTHLGCFNDHRTDRVFEIKLTEADLTTEKCYDYCVSKGASLMATQYSIECFCGDDIGEKMYARHGKTGCDFVCGGDSSEICGGYTAFNLYMIDSDDGYDDSEESTSTENTDDDEDASTMTSELFEHQKPMEGPSGGSEDRSACSTYDENEEMAKLAEGNCYYNTYMCCWSSFDGTEDMESNSDVCRVLDYPAEGSVLEMPRDSEGPVYCHGFAWDEGADFTSYILPLYHYVRNVGGGGFSGSIEGAPECGCVEEMPVVDDAACSKFSRDGIVDCPNGLRRWYQFSLDAPNGPMDSQLVNTCDNTDVPDFDFDTCDHNTYMCCWTENDGQGMQDNTDVCYVGDTGYPGEEEGEVHCHGFVWPEDSSEVYVHLLAQYVQNFDHRDKRGYYGSLKDAPMCGCIEDMPIVSEADCSYPNPEKEGKFKACTKNDLRTRFLEVFPDDPVPNLVEDCDNA
eukprot:g14263.t1